MIRGRICVLRLLECGRYVLQFIPVVIACIIVAGLCRLLKMWIATLDDDKTDKWSSLGWYIMKQVWSFISYLFMALPSDFSGDGAAWVLMIILVSALLVAGVGLVIILFSLLVDALDWLFMSNAGQTAVVAVIVLFLCVLARGLLQVWRRKWRTRTSFEMRYYNSVVKEICDSVGVTTSSDVQKLIMGYYCDDLVLNEVVVERSTEETDPDEEEKEKVEDEGERKTEIGVSTEPLLSNLIYQE